MEGTGCELADGGTEGTSTGGRRPSRAAAVTAGRAAPGSLDPPGLRSAPGPHSKDKEKHGARAKIPSDAHVPSPTGTHVSEQVSPRVQRPPYHGRERAGARLNPPSIPRQTGPSVSKWAVSAMEPHWGPHGSGDEGPVSTVSLCPPGPLGGRTGSARAVLGSAAGTHGHVGDGPSTQVFGRRLPEQGDPRATAFLRPHGKAESGRGGGMGQVSVPLMLHA